MEWVGIASSLALLMTMHVPTRLWMPFDDAARVDTHSGYLPPSRSKYHGAAHTWQWFGMAVVQCCVDKFRYLASSQATFHPSSLFLGLCLSILTDEVA